MSSKELRFTSWLSSWVWFKKLASFLYIFVCTDSPYWCDIYLCSSAYHKQVRKGVGECRRNRGRFYSLHIWKDCFSYTFHAHKRELKLLWKIVWISVFMWHFNFQGSLCLCWNSRPLDIGWDAKHSSILKRSSAKSRVLSSELSNQWSTQCFYDLPNQTSQFQGCEWEIECIIKC